MYEENFSRRKRSYCPFGNNTGFPYQKYGPNKNDTQKKYKFIQLNETNTISTLLVISIYSALLHLDDNISACFYQWKN